MIVLLVAPALSAQSISSSSVSTQTSQPSRGPINLGNLHSQLSGSETLAVMNKVLETDVFDQNGEQEAVKKVRTCLLIIPLTNETEGEGYTGWLVC